MTTPPSEFPPRPGSDPDGMRESSAADFEAERVTRSILAALEALHASHARERRLVVSVGPVYLLSIARAGELALEQEAVASAVLPPELKLSSERGQILRGLGFTKSSGRRNWRRRHGPERLMEVARETVEILERVYGVAEVPSLELTEDDSEHPTNPDLIVAMRKAAKQRDSPTRHALYTELLNATYLVPLADDGDAPLVLETQPSGRPTLGAFSDWSALRLWAPRGWDYAPIHGGELFDLGLEHDAASLRINPEGDVGGELHRNEIEMLAAAVASFRRRHGN